MAEKKIIQMVVDHSTMTIMPKSISDFKFILRYFEDKSEVSVTIEPLIRKKELSQMNLFHGLIGEIEKETGNDFSTCKKEMKKKFGVRNSDGSLKSTGDYSTSELNKLIEGSRLFMIEELGINVPTPEEWKSKKLM